MKPKKVFVMEDDREMRSLIESQLGTKEYNISFFSKMDSIFDLLKFSPDILIQDFATNKVTNVYQWAIPY
jgi:DNA-binding NtrC family response regulator